MDLLKNIDKATAHTIARRVAWLSGSFAALIAVLMLADYRHRLVKDPLDDPAFLALRTELARQPRNETLKHQIRLRDLELRREYFRQRSSTRLGGTLVVIGAALSLVAARIALTLRRKLPTPLLQAAPHDPEIAAVRSARRSVAAVGGAVAAASVVLIATVRTPLARSEAELAAMVGSAAAPAVAAATPAAVTDTSAPAPTAAAPAAGTAATPSPAATTPATAADLPSEEEVAKNWPRFRGPQGLGVVREGTYPTSWNAEENQGIVWKLPVPLAGNNSPILWGGRLFFSGADARTRKVFCCDAQTGKLLWGTEIPPTPQTPSKPPKVMEDTGFAASTMATDGRRAYAMFATADLVAVDFDGKIVWSRGFGAVRNEYGHASSLVCHKGRLIVQLDQGGAKDKMSKLYALDPQTGKTLWETPRPVPASWSTPLVATVAGREQIITCGDPFVIAYNPADGGELWRARCLRQDVGPSPVVANGLAYVASEFPALSAIRADGQGDVTATHIAWTGEDGLPDTCSPLATEEFLVLVATPGTVTCYEAKKGKQLWEKDFDSQFKASPSLVGKLLYLVGDEGKTWVVELGAEEPKEVGTGELGENCVATPVFHQGRIYLRGEKHLFCLGTK